VSRVQSTIFWDTRFFCHCLSPERHFY